jgi:hypothetical protein
VRLRLVLAKGDPSPGSRPPSSVSTSLQVFATAPPGFFVELSRMQVTAVELRKGLLGAGIGLGRYVFPLHDLEPMPSGAPLPGPILAPQLAAGPVTRPGLPPGGPEQVTLPVAVQSREQPDGVPLSRILAAAKAAAPSVAGLAVRGEKLVVTYDRVPTAEEQERLRTFLGDRRQLDELREPAPAGGPATADDLEGVLLDQATPDADWIQAFRRYAVERLIPPREEG